MAGGLHATGEEAILDHFFEESISKPGSVYVGLYHDGEVSGSGGDGLSDDSDLDDISTNTNGGSGSGTNGEIELNFGTSDFSVIEDSGGGDADTLAEIIADPQFDLSGVSNGTIDAYYVYITFQSDTTGDSGATDHLLFSGDLDQGYDVGSIDTFTLDGAGLALQ